MGVKLISARGLWGLESAMAGREHPADPGTNCMVTYITKTMPSVAVALALEAGVFQWRRRSEGHEFGMTVLST